MAPPQRPNSPRVLSLVAFVLGINHAVAGTGEPYESPVYMNFCQAEELLQKALIAHGGKALRERSTNITIAYDGRFSNEAHYARPWATRDYDIRNGIWKYSSEWNALLSDSTYFFDRPLPTLTVLDSQQGWQRDAGAPMAEAILPEDLNRAWQSEWEMFPHEFLRQAETRRETLRHLGGDEQHDVLEYNAEDGTRRALLLDKESSLLHRVERIGHWKRKGDRLEWREFRDYQPDEDAQIPRTIIAHEEHGGSKSRLTLHLRKIQLGVEQTDDDFAIPHSHRSAIDRWDLQRPSPPEVDSGFLPVHDLGDGVSIIDLPSSDARSLLVEFSDFTLIAEAGDNSEISERMLATVENRFPEKPVRYVAMSHHHPLYTGGIRPYVYRGVTILATEGNVEYLTDLATRPYRIQPDAQHQDPLDPEFEIIDDLLVLEDESQRVEFHEFDFSQHTDEFVLTFVPSHGLVVTGDLVSVPTEGELRPAGPRARAVHRLIRERDLDVEVLMQTWYLRDGKQLAPIADLREMVGLLR